MNIWRHILILACLLTEPSTSIQECVAVAFLSSKWQMQTELDELTELCSLVHYND